MYQEQNTFQHVLIEDMIVFYELQGVTMEEN